MAEGVRPALTADEDDAEEDGRMLALSDRAPFWKEEEEEEGESWVDA